MPDLSWARQRKFLRAPTIGYNAEVYRHFRDIDNFPNRLAVRDLCLITAKDSRLTADSKMRFFYDRVLKLPFKPTVVGILKENFDDAQIKYKCQIQLYFKQDLDSVPDSYAPLDAQITFRIDETAETITEAKYKALASKIRLEFALNNGYRWSKGKYICWYKDAAKGYDLQIYALNATEGEQVIKKVLNIQGHVFEEDNFRITEPKKASDNITSNQTILGKSYKKRRWRPTGYVRFAYADLIVHGISDPICLVDRTGSRYRPVHFVP